MSFKLPKPAFAVSAVLLLAIGAVPTSARADSVTTVPSFFCAGGDHVAYRPAGSTIVIRSRWAEQTLGTLTSFLNAQTTTLSINGGARIDGTSLYSVPFFVPASPSQWITGFDTPTGITLRNPGDSLIFHVTLSLARPVAEVFNRAGGGPAGKPGIIGPGTIVDGDCTVIGT
jgi:hypothetical protein